MTTDESSGGGSPQPAGEPPGRRAAAGASRRRPASEAPRRWPAEWEPHAATWLAWPHAPDTWPGRLEAVERAYVEIVRIAVDGEPGEDRARRLLRAGGVEPDRGIELLDLPTDDAWLRDTGPIFIQCGDAPLALDFRFDAWGGKYPPWDRDDRVAGRIAAHLGVPAEHIDVVLEGGSIDGNGDGTVLTTESCLLHPNRGPGGVARGREEMERVLAERLGARHVLWLGDGIAGDDTDGHIDDITRFIARDTVVTCVQPDLTDVDHAPLADNRERLRAMSTADGAPLQVIELPMPDPVMSRGDRLPASHANFLIANGAVLVPVFGGASDERALAILRECLPGRDIIGIPARDLVVGLGAVHCLTQQEPARPSSPGSTAGGG